MRDWDKSMNMLKCQWVISILTVVVTIGCSAVNTTVPTGESGIPTQSEPSREETVRSTQGPIPTMLASPSRTAVSVPECSVGHVVVSQTDEMGAVYLFCADGSSFTQLVSGRFFITLLPDGDRVAAGYEPMLISISDPTETETPLAFDPDIGQYRWDPSMEYVAYARDQSQNNSSGVSSLEILHLASGVVSEVFIGPLITNVGWALDGSHLLLTTDETNNYEVHLIDIVCDASHTCVSNSARELRTVGYHPSLSPDGKHITSLVEEYDPTHHYTILISNLEDILIRSIDVTALASDLWNIDYPVLSHEGMRIAFTSEIGDSGKTDLFVLSLEDGNLTNLTSEFSHNVGGRMAWVP